MMKFSLILAITQIAITASSLQAAVSVDGQRDTGEYSGTPLLVSDQTQTALWGAGNVIANLHAVQEAGSLHVFLGGRASNNAIILFIDSKPGGSNVIPNTFTGGDGYQINNLYGMTLPTGFTADYAVRFFGDSGANNYVNLANFSTNAISYLGNAGFANVSNSFVSDAKVQQFDVTDLNSDTVVDALDYPMVVKGIEMKFNIATLGVPTGSQTVKLFAILVQGDSTNSPNQVLSPNATPVGMGALGDENFASQGLTITVSNPSLFDSDGDNIADIYETNTGIYNSPSDTGSNPLLFDTDGDGESDENEVFGTFRTAPLNFVSNPNVKTYAMMAVPGSYTTPVWKEDGSAQNMMVRKGTSIVDQDMWTLDYNFTRTWRDLVQLNTNDGIAEDSFNCKIAAGTWTNNWGGRGTTLAVNGANIPHTIVATGIHRFSFNSATLAFSVTRPTYDTAADYYTAYGITDPDADPDGDMLTNAQEAALNSDPNNNDTDGDGVLDQLDGNVLVPAAYPIWVQSYAPLTPALRGDDADGDGFNNLYEFLFGGNPKSGADQAVKVTVDATNATLTWLGRSVSSQASYFVETSAILSDAWIASGVTPSDAADQTNVPTGYKRYQVVIARDGASRFYRVVGTEL